MLFSDLNKKLLVLQNVAEEGFYRLVEAQKNFSLSVSSKMPPMTSPRERLMDRSELKSVLRALAKVGSAITIFNTNMTQHHHLQKGEFHKPSHFSSMRTV